MKYMDRVGWARAQRNLSMGARFLLRTINEFTNDDDMCWPSAPTICAEMGCSRRQVFRWLAELEAAGLIKRLPGYVGRSNRYRLLTRDTQSRVGLSPVTDSHVPETHSPGTRDTQSRVPETHSPTNRPVEPSIEGSNNRFAHPRDDVDNEEEERPSRRVVGPMLVFDDPVPQPPSREAYTEELYGKLERAAR